MISLEGQNILVTGASSGIGRQCAIAVAEAGGCLALTGRNEDRLAETLGLLKPGRHRAYSVDITDASRMEEVISERVSEIGPFSGLVSSAGIEATVPLRRMSSEKYVELLSVNAVSAFEIARIMTKKKHIIGDGASLVFIGSVMAVKGEKGKIGYCASKGALSAGVKALALELAPKRIRANCLLPGVVETEMTRTMFENLPEDSVQSILEKHPLGFGAPSDISNLALFLLSDLARWITGADLVIDGGYSCA